MSYLLKKIRSETAQQRPSSSQEEQAKVSARLLVLASLPV
jgi:hypothetical protein